MLFSQAVDFPKTGKVVQMPREIKVDKYPDFMEKYSNSYVSDKIVGKMYRKCKQIFSNDSYTNDSIHLNKSLLVPGYEDYLLYANEMYYKYRNEMETIITNANCKQESELFVGIYLSSVTANEDEKEYFKLCSAMIKDLWENMRQEITQDLKSKYELLEDNKTDISNHLVKVASSFYYVAYSSSLNNEQRIISFPWILEDYLYKISFKNEDIFNNNLIKHVYQTQFDLKTMARYFQKSYLCKRLSVVLNGRKTILIGSFGLFLFEESNKCEVVIYDSDQTSVNIVFR
jgi:hypothetical protein